MDIQPYGDNFIPVILIEDEPRHTDNKRFCGDPECGCREEPALIETVNKEYLDGLLTAAEASRIVEGKQI